MWELDYKESWAQKNWRFWTVVLEKTLQSPLEGDPQIYPKGNQSWIFIGRTDVEALTLVFWSPVAKSWLIWKDPDAGKDWRREEKRTTEYEMVGWHHDAIYMCLSKLGSWWWTGRPGVLQSMGPQIVGHDWATKLTDWLNLIYNSMLLNLKVCKNNPIILAFPWHDYMLERCETLTRTTSKVPSGCTRILGWCGVWKPWWRRWQFFRWWSGVVEQGVPPSP